MNNKINRSHLLVIVAVFCLIISGCLGGGITSDLPACETLYDSSLDWTDCQGNWTHADGSQYVGEYKDGFPHGQGTYTFPDGTQYVGEFKYDVFHGQGTETFANGDIENGRWQDGNFLG